MPVTMADYQGRKGTRTGPEEGSVVTLTGDYWADRHICGGLTGGYRTSTSLEGSSATLIGRSLEGLSAEVMTL